MLSGYLITSILLAEHAATGRIDLRAFYTRRALRLFPALALLIVAAALPAEAGGRSAADLRLHRLGGVASLYLGDFVRAGGGTLGPLDHTWSLAVEEQFYLVWPLVAAGAAVVGPRGRRKLLRGVAALAAVAAGWTVLAAFLLPFARTYFAPDTNAFALMAGCALAAWLPVRPQRRRDPPGRPGWPSPSSVPWRCSRRSTRTASTSGSWSHAALLYGLAAIVLIVAAVRCPDRGPLVWKPVTWFGTSPTACTCGTRR